MSNIKKMNENIASIITLNKDMMNQLESLNKKIYQINKNINLNQKFD